MTELPAGWAMTTLAQVLKSVTDGTHAPPARHEAGLPLLSAKDIRNGGIRVADPRLASEDYVSSEMRRTSLAEGDVLLTIVGTIGRSTVVGPSPRFALQRSVAILKPGSILPHFLSFYLQSSHADAYYQVHARGTAQRGLYLRELQGLPVPLASLAEQARVVAAIEEQFSRLDAGVAALERVRQNLKRMWAAVLQAAVTGQLAPQDPNDEPAFEWLGFHGKRCSPPEPGKASDLPIGWARTTIGDLKTWSLYGPRYMGHGSLVMTTLPPGFRCFVQQTSRQAERFWSTKRQSSPLIPQP